MNLHGTLLAALLGVLALAGCGRAASRVVADALSSGGGNAYASDDDPELVRDAVPFGLKTMEALLEKHPEHEGLFAVGLTQANGSMWRIADYQSELVANLIVAGQLAPERARAFARTHPHGGTAEGGGDSDEKR